MVHWIRRIRAVEGHHGMGPFPLTHEVARVYRTVLNGRNITLSIAEDSNRVKRVMKQKGRHLVKASVRETNYYYRKKMSIEIGNGQILCPVTVDTIRRELKVVTPRGKITREPTPRERGRWAEKFQKI